MSHLANAGVIGLHMVSGPIVGFALGYALDTYLGIHPFGKIACLILGICAGFLNVYRDTQDLLQKMAKSDVSRTSVQEEQKQTKAKHPNPDHVQNRSAGTSHPPTR